MKLLIQRVNFAKVVVENQIVGSIKKGLLVFVGFSKDFTKEKQEYLINKLLKLRLWASENKGFDKNIKDIGGELLIISQFTLFGDCSEGNKPNFQNAMPYDEAKTKYGEFVTELKKSGLKIEQGVFGAMMNVTLENDGPVTIILEK